MRQITAKAGYLNDEDSSKQTVLQLGTVSALQLLQCSYIVEDIYASDPRDATVWSGEIAGFGHPCTGLL
jgi:hypothetical protein